MKVKFAKVYCGSWEPYMLDPGPHGLNTGLKFRNVKSLMEHYGLQNRTYTGEQEFAITATGIKRMYKVYEADYGVEPALRQYTIWQENTPHYSGYVLNLTVEQSEQIKVFLSKYPEFNIDGTRWIAEDIQFIPNILFYKLPDNWKDTVLDPSEDKGNIFDNAQGLLKSDFEQINYHYLDAISGEYRIFAPGMRVYYLGTEMGEVLNESEVLILDGKFGGTTVKSLDTQTHKYKLKRSIKNGRI